MRGTPRLIIAPVIGIAADELPAWAGVERADSEHALEGWPEPRRGIIRRVAASPTLTDPARAETRECPGRPFSICKERGERFRRGLAPRQCAARPGASESPLMCMGSNGRITPKAWDYSAEPPSHWTSQSPGIQRYEHSNMAGDELRLLSLIGSQVYRLSDPRFRRQATRLHDSDDHETNSVSLRARVAQIEINVIFFGGLYRIVKQSLGVRSSQRRLWGLLPGNPCFELSFSD